MAMDLGESVVIIGSLDAPVGRSAPPLPLAGEGRGGRRAELMLHLI
jgi:hypothetical protein